MPTARTDVVQATPNVTPMIDVMLVLLVIFMVAAPAMLVGIPAVPPVAENSSNRPEQPADRVLGIDRRGTLYLDRRPIDRESLAAALRSSYASGAIDRVLYVRADKDVEYGVVQDALDLAARNGAVVVGMISEQAPPKRQAH
ncbi:MAG TPA: biopolymer transporter ExbD [Gemmatimonadaceae bacterium]|nr:biopolymer transporter ExbD [Gemmatimonadaceae bacterium]